MSLRSNRFCYFFSVRIGTCYAAGYMLVIYGILRTAFGIWMLIRADSLPEEPGRFRFAVRITGFILLCVAAVGLVTFICLLIGLWKRFRHYLVTALILMVIIFLTEIATSIYSLVYWNTLHHEHVLERIPCPYERTRIVMTPSQTETNIQIYTAIWNLVTTFSAFYLCCVIYNYQRELQQRQALTKVAETEHSKAWAGTYHVIAWSRNK